MRLPSTAWNLHGHVVPCDGRSDSPLALRDGRGDRMGRRAGESPTDSRASRPIAGVCALGGTEDRARSAPSRAGRRPRRQARETIRRPIEPLGAATVTVSPARRPISARPTGEVLLMRPSAGDASWLPTIV